MAMHTWRLLTAAFAAGLASIAGAQPVNDECTNAIVITAPSDVQGDSTGASGFDLSSCAGTGDVLDVWFSITVATGGVVTFDTIGGATWDTTLSAFSACDGVELACNDDTNGLQSRINVNFAMGQTVLIRVAGFGGASGPFTMHVSAPQIPTGNDDCGGALVLMPGATVTGSNAGATGTNLSSCAGAGDVNDVWYRFTAATSGTHAFDTLGTVGLDTTLSVFDSCGGSELVCDDDAAGNLLSRVQLFLNTGQTVFVRVAGYNGQQGPFTLSSRVPSTPAPNDNCPDAEAVAVLPHTYTRDASGSAEDLDVSCNDGAATSTANGVWFTYTPGATQLVRFSDTSPANIVVTIFTGPCESLSEVFCSDAEDFVYPLQGGTAYRILVGAFPATGHPLGVPLNFSMQQVNPPTNDTCDTAEIVTGSPFNHTVDISTATNDVDVACNAAANTETRNGVWYRFTPAETGRVVFNETSANDVVFAVFTGSCEGGLTEVYCNGTEPSAPFDVAAGTVYHVLVGLNSATAGATAPISFVLGFTPAPGACCAGTACTIVANAGACSGSWRGAGSTCGDPQGTDDSDVAIPDYPFGGPVTPVSSVVAINESITISDLDIVVEIFHEYAGDVFIRLTGPNSQTVELFKRAGTPSCTPGELATGGGGNDLNGRYVFDDEATTTLHAAVLAGPSPIAPGRYLPSGCGGAATSLDAVFGGQSATGVWTLEVSDEDEGVVGTVLSFGLIINGGVNQPCASGGDNGACCRNAACEVASSSACTGPGQRFVGANSVCNATGNIRTPCCKADTNQDGDITLQDLFDFLVLWFSQAPGANTDGSPEIGIQDIFDYLRAWLTACQ